MASEDEKMIIFSVHRMNIDGYLPYIAHSLPTETIEECFRRTYPKVFEQFGHPAPSIEKPRYTIGFSMPVRNNSILVIKNDLKMADLYSHFLPNEKTVNVNIFEIIRIGPMERFNC